MYSKINITENGLQVLILFTEGFDRDFHIREAGKILGISPRTAQLILEDLENKGIVSSKVKGKIKSYRLQMNERSRRYIAFVEQYKALAFLSTHLVVREIIEKISPFVDGIGVIFGSYAKGADDKDSDLDIFVAGAYDHKELRRISMIYGMDLSVKCYPAELFRKKIASDILIKEVKKNHIVFKGSDAFVGEVFGYAQD